MNTELYLLKSDLKRFLAVFVFLLTAGVMIGLSYLYFTTSYSPREAITRYNGSGTEQNSNKETDELDIPENYPRPVSELLVTTHNHVISFSLIFGALGMVFYFNSIITGWFKNFLLVEPFISTLLSFGGLWLMRFANENFVYLTVVSSCLIYLSFFLMSGTVLYELIFKKAKQ